MKNTMNIGLAVLVVLSTNAFASEGKIEHPVEQLNRSDRRTAVPLLPRMALHMKQNMMDHLSAVQELTEKLALSDFTGAEKAAGRLGLSGEMAQMCEHMGAGALGYNELGIKMHKAADAIVPYLKRKDSKGALQALGNTLRACNTCHSTFRQEVVSSEAFEVLSKTKASQHKH